MDNFILGLFWEDIPIGKQNAVTYSELSEMWAKSERNVRKLLHDLSLFDNGDNYILVRSSSGKGFYKTDDPATLKAYRQECLNKGKSVFAPVKKINRVLKANATQFNFENNLRAIRETKGLKQKDVCKIMQQTDKAFDVTMLSKMENNVCLPTPMQLAQLAGIYDVDASDLLHVDMYI